MVLIYLGLIIGALGLLTSVLIPVVIYLKQRGKKEISYIVYDKVSLVNIKEEVKENFEVSYNGIPVRDATLLSIRVWNSGKAPIEEADFVDPIKLDFGKDAKLIFVSVASNPDNILGQFKHLGGEGYFTFKPRLFNKGYEITVTVMVTGFSGYVKAEGLIKGVHLIRNVKFPSYTNLSWKLALFGALLTCVSGLVIGFSCILSFFGEKFITHGPDYVSSIFLFIGCMVLGVFFIPSAITVFEILSMKDTDRFSLYDSDFIKQLFSKVQAYLEKEAQNQTPQRAKRKKTPPASQ